MKHENEIRDNLSKAGYDVDVKCTVAKRDDKAYRIGAISADRGNMLIGVALMELAPYDDAKQALEWYAAKYGADVVIDRFLGRSMVVMQRARTKREDPTIDDLLQIVIDNPDIAALSPAERKTAAEKLWRENNVNSTFRIFVS